MREKRVGAFITIEYTLLIPVLLLLYTCLIYMGLFLHNRCVLQANVYMLGLEGSRLTAAEPAEKVVWLQSKEKQLYHKYILAEELYSTYHVQGNNIQISSSGQMANPFSVVGMGASTWTLNAECEVTAMSPVNTLRLCELACSFLENASSKEEQADDSGTEFYSGESEELY